MMKSLLEREGKHLNSYQWSYKLGEGSQYGLDAVIGDTTFDESRMSMIIPFADGNRRDGVGDLLEVGGIRTERHRQNPITLFDHGKGPHLWSNWPIALAEDPETKEYTVKIDPVERTATMNSFFYQGKGIPGADRQQEKDFAVHCEQLYDLACKKFIRAGSIGYQVVKALPLQSDPSTGTPQGMHLLVVLMLEGSLVVLPANMDTVVKVLAMPTVCGKSLSPMLRKSLEVYAPEKKAQLGYEGKGYTDNFLQSRDDYENPMSDGNVPAPDWRAGEGAKAQPSDDISPEKARQILKDGEANGKPLTDKQRGMFGAAAGKEMPDQVTEGLFNRTKEIRKRIRAKAIEDEGVRSRAGVSGSLTYGFAVGDTVIARRYLYSRNSAGKMTTFAETGERLTIEKMEGNGWVILRNRKGELYRGIIGAIRKSLDSEVEVKSLQSLRKKYRTSKGLRRRLRKSVAGAAIVHMNGKDISAAQEMAEAKGLKFQRMGVHESGAERVKLIGDDEQIDSVAREFGKMVKHLQTGSKAKDPATGMKRGGKFQIGERVLLGNSRGVVENRAEGSRGWTYVITLDSGGHVNAREEELRKTKHLQIKGKAMDDDNLDVNDIAEEQIEEQPSSEPWGAQVLRRLHEDGSMLMKDYDEMVGPLEHEQVKSHLEDHMGAIDKFLTKTEQLFNKHYKDLPPLAGAMDDEEAKELDDEEDKDADVALADSEGEEDEPTGEEALEGMETKELDPDEMKRLRMKRRKMLARRKSACAECGKENCSCGKSLRRHRKDMEEEEKDFGDTDVTEDYSEEKALEPHELEKVQEAHKFLKDLSEEQNFGDEHRMKAYHFHKALEPMGDVKSEVGSPEWAAEEAAEHEHKNGEMPLENVEQKSCRKSIGELSKFFKELSQEKNYGEPHRMKALTFHKELEPHVTGPETGTMGLEENELETKALTVGSTVTVRIPPNARMQGQPEIITGRIVFAEKEDNGDLVLEVQTRDGQTYEVDAAWVKKSIQAKDGEEMETEVGEMGEKGYRTFSNMGIYIIEKWEAGPDGNLPPNNGPVYRALETKTRKVIAEADTDREIRKLAYAWEDANVKSMQKKLALAAKKAAIAQAKQIEALTNKINGVVSRISI